ncbi:MAG: lysine--tRNA ligase [Geminicoccaceae bacterium]|nr:lysine--tRNA ligase [Geminicoccaceae bacterium]MDW8123326.1 lysine--tRNA ligase [Geminicoccaceae bacterium]
MTVSRELFARSKAWPVLEALKVVERVRRRPPAKGYVLFETGYGPSGLPHIGTFGEVFRTTLVRRAFARLHNLPTELVAFSDDMDGLRKVPDNIPNREMVAQYLGRPLTSIPDPFGTHESFGHHMNARLKAFLDDFGFSYTFLSATECYKSGRFDATLLKVLEHHDEIREVILPTLGPERRATYSPILPISPKTGRVLQVPILETRPASGTVIFRDEDGTLTEVPVTGGHCKMQWKCDWAMRWVALDVDYEMSGKDLIDSVRLGSKICRILGGEPPEGFTYELFLDENGQKISKSKGNGLTIEEWLRYGTRESLALFMYKEPKAAKRLYFDVIPRHVDEYQQLLEAYPEQDDEKKIGNPVFYIHDGDPPVDKMPISYSMLLNLASVLNAQSAELLWSYISRYVPGVSPATHPKLARLVEHALAYCRDFVLPARRFRAPTALEREALCALRARLAELPEGTDGETIQNLLYEIGRAHRFANLRDWFKALYETLLGQSEGPRFGTFVAIYGIRDTLALIDQALVREAEAA